MSLTAFFDIKATLVHIPLGMNGYNMSWIEALTVLVGCLTLWFARKEKRITFLFGLINAVLYSLILYQIQLYSLITFHAFLFLTSLYGLYAWAQPPNNKKVLIIRWLEPNLEVFILGMACITIGFTSFFIDFIFSYLYKMNYMLLDSLAIKTHYVGSYPSPYPLVDASVICLSIIAQLLLIKKYVENWIFLGAVNLISLGIYLYLGVYILAIQYAIYLLLSVSAMQLWSHKAGDTKSIRAKYLKAGR
jgi:nicotinamide mononucleotide transporter